MDDSLLQRHRLAEVANAQRGHRLEQGGRLVEQLRVVGDLRLDVAKHSLQVGDDGGRVRCLLAQQLRVLDALVPVALHGERPHQLPVRHLVEHFVLLLDHRLVAVDGLVEVARDLHNLGLGHLVEDAL